MRSGLTRAAACSLALLVSPALGWGPALAQGDTITPAGVPPAASAPPGNPAPAYPPQQLDQLMAPIALYPDPLLSQILMASTYPLEIVEAARWVQDPNNAGLHGDQLDAALQPQPWDPSVKSLVPFPQVLQMMNSRLDWTQALGNAFLAQQADVTASIQRLRGQAQTAGHLQSSPQETVSNAGGAIVIEPANPELVYVPYYDPRLIYGSWGYPQYPPIYFLPPPSYGYVAGPRIYFGVGFGIVAALWGWDRWDWGHHEIHVDAGRYDRINNYQIDHNSRPRYSATTWQHDPAHRHGVPYAAGVRQQFQPAAAASPAARRDFRGFDPRGAATAAQNAAPRTPAPQTRAPQTRAPQARAPETAHVAPPPQPPTVRGVAPPRAAAQHPAGPTSFTNYGRGPDVRAQSQRGQASRQSMAPQHSAPPQQHSAPPQHAPPAGGQRGGGHDDREHH